MADIWSKYQGENLDLDIDTVKKIIYDLNIPVYPHYFKQEAMNLMGPMAERLTYSDFIGIVHNLTEHSELNAVFEKYGKTNKEGVENEEFTFNPTISLLRLIDFYKEEQKESLNLTECKAMVQVGGCFLYNEFGNFSKFSTDELPKPNTQRGLSDLKFEKQRIDSEKSILKQQVSTEMSTSLGLMGFSTLLCSRTNTVWDRKMSINFDMSYPLSHYLINSSHFTYLKIKHDNENNCDIIDVSAKNYTKYLLKGVRCIDINLIVFL